MYLGTLLWKFLILIIIICNSNAEISTDLMKRLGEYLKDNDFSWLLQDLTKRIIDDLDCLTIISDKYYNGFFSSAVFEQISTIPLFKIMVKENEDLLAPNYKTLSVIKQARRKGCNVYIVLIANGDEAARLLRFGDRNRVIDTRAKYILLYDSRLFLKKHVYLWKKIVNVLFIHKYFEVNRYEITTVPFPSPIGNYFKPVWVDSWRAGKFQKNNDLFSDKTSNLLSETLHVATFAYMPSTIKKISEVVNKNDDENTNEISVKYSGLEVQILNSLSDAMNFQGQIYEPVESSNEAWGRKQLNGSYSGLLGEMVSGRADIALGNFLYTPNNLKLLDLSIPYTTQCFTFLTPESTTDNSWKTLTLPFKGYMWLGVMLTLVICSLVFYGLARFHENLEFENAPFTKLNTKHSFWKDLSKLWHDTKNVVKKRDSKSSNIEASTSGLHIFGDINSSLMNSYSMLLLVSLPKMPTGWSLRTFTGCWWLYCILVTVAYRASMTAILANPAQRVTIDTLDELATSPIECGGWGEQNKEFFITSLDSAGQRVGRKFEVIYKTSEAINRVAKGHFAYYENIYFLHHAKASQKAGSSMKDTGSNMTNAEQEEKDLHIMRDCVINMPISLGLQKNSPLKPRVDKFLQRVIEAGLVKKWLADTMLNTTVSELPLQKDGMKALMDLKKFVGALVALGVGCILGTVALIFENIHWMYIVKRDPLFDVYDKSHYFDRKPKLKRFNFRFWK